ncbi:MAG: TonB-dependent receptor [Verrucomicrobia bacterium]|nr:TonB-dependent receptor [Verrucomicrobiota bacterium]
MRAHLLFLLAASQVALAQSAPAAPKASELAPLTVTGIAPDAFILPGSASVIEGDEFRSKGYTNIKQIAANTPGVFVRDEDGFGNFPNISIRGVDGTRSAKVTLMEDGILTAPSPYSSPNAYYAPKSGRMAGIEFLKGSSQVMYGPHTTGGVVNFLSTPIPTEERRFFSRLTAGSYGNFFNHTWLGGTQQTEAGRVGAVVELHTQLTDGFRVIDGVGRRSGFTLTEPMVKLSWEPTGALRQRFELKVGQTDFDADETYGGLSEADLRANPDRRYASTRFDHHVAEQWRTYLKWSAEPDKSLRLDSALYFNQFDRDWDKLDGLSGAGLRTNVAEALAHAPSLAVLRGDLFAGNDGAFVTNDAVRNHESYGWQGSARKQFQVGDVRHELTGGLRIHRDTAGGTNQRTTYAVDDGVIGVGTRAAVTSAGFQETLAAAAFVEDAIRLGALTLRPGLRYEYLDMANTTSAGAFTPVDSEMAMGGLGFTYELDARNTVFGGVYRGGSAANPSGYAAGTRSEESLGKELGLRHRDRATSWELTAFHTDFRDLIAPVVGVAGGGLLAMTNGGAAESYGVEALVRHDLARGEGRGYALPVYAGLTWTRARFTEIEGSRLGNGAGLFAGAESGNEIPYVPEWKLAAGVGFEQGPWGGSLDLSYYSATWGTGYNGDPRLVDGSGALANPSTIDGKVDGLLTVDLNLRYQLTKAFRLVGGVQNLLDRRAIISRAPLGPRANAPRTLFFGGEVAF